MLQSCWKQPTWAAQHRSRRLVHTTLARMNDALGDPNSWTSLSTPRAELCLSNTLPTGQSFRWRLTSPDTYTGVIGQRVVEIRQLHDDVQYRVLARGPGAAEAANAGAEAAALRDYLNLKTNLAALCRDWCSRDDRFEQVSRHLPGCRMLRQDPVECLFQFICSSNNHISRIHGMVERLCSTYGSELLPSSHHQQQQQHVDPATPAAARQWQQQHSPDAAALGFTSPAAAPSIPFSHVASSTTKGGSAAAPSPSAAAAAAAALSQPKQQQLAFYAFPTLEQLAAATEADLRADGFGYRAKFIVGSVQLLLDKPEGGAAWLLNLRHKPYAEAQEALCTLPGIGPKVAACICLFSLDKHDAIPVDTHVWNLATRYYAPQLANKTLSAKLHGTVQQVFVKRFGAYAGWAHNTLFVSELASHKHLLPDGLASPGRSGPGSSSKAGSSKRSSSKAGSSKAGSSKKRSRGSSNGVGSGSDAEGGGAAAGAAAMADAAAALVTAEVGTSPGSPSIIGSSNASSTGAAAAAAAVGVTLGSRRRSSRARTRNTKYSGSSDAVAAAGSSGRDD